MINLLVKGLLQLTSTVITVFQDFWNQGYNMNLLVTIFARFYHSLLLIFLSYQPNLKYFDFLKIVKNHADSKQASPGYHSTLIHHALLK